MCVDFVVDKSWCARAVIEPHDPISCKNCFLSYGDFCVLYSGKSDIVILGKGGCGRRGPT